MTDGDWDEQEYRRYLAAERRAFAWTLTEIGGIDPADARNAARAHYPYQAPTAELRGLVFHDEAWHWAMLRLHGAGYWHRDPDLLHPPSDYEAIWDAGYAENPDAVAPRATPTA